MISAYFFRRAIASAVLGLMLLTWTSPQVLAQECQRNDPAGYDPGDVHGKAAPEILELSVHDDLRSRAIPLRLVLPSPPPPLAPPVILFSHGLGGSRRTSEFLGTHWAARGFAAVFPQHPGSDDSVWKNASLGQRRRALAQAASAANAEDRILDIRAVLEQLDRWASTPEHPLASRLDLSQVGMSGHSFGAVTTQSLSGQLDPLTDQHESDLRIRAAIAMSPSVPLQANLQDAFGSVRIPWLIMTGSDDHAPMGRMPPEARRDVFNHLPESVDRYELVLGGAHHFAFTANDLPPHIPPRNAHHHQSILRISTAFWDAYLRGDPAAKHWLQGDAIRSTLDPADRWRIGIAKAEAGSQSDTD